mmetsp:Transcript_22026/g.54511  ORF Transcript_22026/g.54511 Transcript_22026/m.54511 type:complete len:229 (+) Transcript_22026:1823-2509(+)
MRQCGLARARRPVHENTLGVRGYVRVHVLAGAHGQDAVLREHLPHLRHGRVRHDAGLLQGGTQVVEVAYIVADGACWDGLDDFVGNQLGVKALQAPVRRGVLLALLFLVLLVLLALLFRLLFTFFVLLTTLGRSLCSHHVLQVLQQHPHLLVHLHANFLEHHGLERLSHQLRVVLLEEVGALVDVLPVDLVVAHRTMDELDEVVGTLGLLARVALLVALRLLFSILGL